MAPTARMVTLWGPRVLALLFGIFLSLFALDVFGEERGTLATLSALAIHLIPTAILLVLVAAAWHREWIGAAAFLSVGAAYAFRAAPRHPDWALVIAGPLFVVGALYLWSWSQHDESPGRH